MTTITHRRASAGLILCLAWPAAALELPQGARMLTETTSEQSSYRLPTGPWQEEGGIPSARVEGIVTRQAWRIDGQSATTLQLLAPLRAQLLSDGFEVVFECAASVCGGFDFRFETEVLPGPAMYVNLTDYRFLSARRTGADAEAVSLLVSRTSSAGFVQIIRVGTGEEPPDPVTATLPTDPAPEPGSLARELERAGHVVLPDLDFSSGSSDLGDGAVPSLDRIADYLQANPQRQIVFVGHTDATGSLDANIALSRRRAEAAVRYLDRRHGLDGSRVSAEGVGYLAPLASNLSDEGRRRNRRIEAVLSSTE